MSETRVSQMTRKEIREAIEHIVRMMHNSPKGVGVGTTLNSRAKITAIIREAGRRMRADPTTNKEGKDGSAG